MILAITILILVLINSILYDFLQMYFKRKIVKYAFGYAIFSKFFIILSAINFFHYFDLVTAIILTYIVISCLHVKYVFFPILFLLHYVHIKTQKDLIFLPGNFAYSGLAIYVNIIYLILILTIISFFFKAPLLQFPLSMYWFLPIILSLVFKEFTGNIIINAIEEGIKNSKELVENEYFKDDN